jgi:hypothetical protein
MGKPRKGIKIAKKKKLKAGEWEKKLTGGNGVGDEQNFGQDG